VRPEDVVVSGYGSEPSTAAVPIDVELEALGTELDAAGAHARRTLNGQRQPTRFFSLELRAELLDLLETGQGGPLTRR
jgi:hypothetical protein